MQPQGVLPRRSVLVFNFGNFGRPGDFGIRLRSVPSVAISGAVLGFPNLPSWSFVSFVVKGFSFSLSAIFGNLGNFGNPCVLASPPPLFSAQSLPADTPASYLSSTQSRRIHPADACAGENFCSHTRLPGIPAGTYSAPPRASPLCRETAFGPGSP